MPNRLDRPGVDLVLTLGERNTPRCRTEMRRGTIEHMWVYPVPDVDDFSYQSNQTW